MNEILLKNCFSLLEILIYISSIIKKQTLRAKNKFPVWPTLQNRTGLAFVTLILVTLPLVNCFSGQAIYCMPLNILRTLKNIYV